MTELNFVHKVQNYIRADHPGAVVLKPNDRNTQGIPDLLVFHHSCTAALELKSVDHQPRDRFAPWLSHPFTMPQVVLLRDMAAQGVVALGLIEYRIEDAIYAMHPMDLTPSLSLNDVIDKGKLVEDGVGFLHHMKMIMAQFNEKRRS
jgi:hypothetical protein